MHLIDLEFDRRNIHISITVVFNPVVNSVL